jgi:two-component system cell cycle response regulator CpdR
MTADKLLILVVEDTPLILMDMEDALLAAGYASVSTESGESAITILEDTPEIRALITDINLSRETTGWEVARRARELYPNLPVIYVTSISEADWTSQGVPKSMLISKPFAHAQITTAVSQLLNDAENPAQSM